jgi:hypothetical protein
MRPADHEKLQAELELADCYDLGDAFLNYRHPDPLGGTATCRVVRIIGPERFLMLFDFGSLGPYTTSSWIRSTYKCRYLHENGDLIEFGPQSNQPNIGWETAVSAYLRENGALTFKGRGWHRRLAMKLTNLVTRWERHYSNVKAKR